MACQSSNVLCSGFCVSVFLFGALGVSHAIFAVTYLRDIRHAISAEYVKRNCTVEVRGTVEKVEALDVDLTSFITWNPDFVWAAFQNDHLPKVIVKVDGVGSPVAAYKYTETFSNTRTASYSPSSRAWAESFAPGSNVPCWQGKNNTAFVEGTPMLLTHLKPNTHVVKLSEEDGVNGWTYFILTKLSVVALVCILLALDCAKDWAHAIYYVGWNDCGVRCGPCYAGDSESDSETGSMIDNADPCDEE